jgi:hypothetical protein
LLPVPEPELVPQLSVQKHGEALDNAQALLSIQSMAPETRE